MGREVQRPLVLRTDWNNALEGVIPAFAGINGLKTGSPGALPVKKCQVTPFSVLFRRKAAEKR